MKEQKDTLIALLKEKKDLPRAQQQLWYRIPVKSAPLMVKDGSIKYIGLYQPMCFKEEALRIRWYGKVDNITTVKRKELIPEEYRHPGANKDYYKITFKKLYERKSPVLCQRKRRMLFITTSFSRFKEAKEINDLFLESPLEEKLWEALKSVYIEAERQFWVSTIEGRYCLDFAIFSKTRNIDVECDGDTYHSGKREVQRDKQRNNQLENYGWAVFRYTPDDIMRKLSRCLFQIKKAVNQFGGLQSKTDPGYYRLLK